MKMNAVIKCWNEGLQKMKPGGKARMVCPPDLAYGEIGAGDIILPYATLVFEVELIEIKK
jgi:FKBP-type peptidyl-prolyl cis-trans isomerase FkpA